MRQLQHRASLAPSTGPAPAMSMPQRPQRPPRPAPSPVSRKTTNHGTGDVGLSLVQQAKKDAAPAPQPLREVFRTLCLAALGAMSSDPRPLKRAPAIQKVQEAPAPDAGQAVELQARPSAKTDRRRS